jgi:hypothetical protein
VPQHPYPEPFYPNAKPGRIVNMDCICAPSESNCPEEYIKELRALIADYTNKITKGRKRQLELISIIEQTKKDIKKNEDYIKLQLELSTVAMEWSTLYKTVQDDFRKITFNVGCFGIVDAFGGTGDDVLDFTTNESFTFLVATYAKRIAAQRAAQIAIYGATGTIAATILGFSSTALTYITVAGTVTGLFCFCLALDVGRGSCVAASVSFKQLTEPVLSILLDNKLKLRNLEIEKKQLDMDMGNWYRNKQLNEENLKYCLGLDISLIPNPMAVLKLQALPCKTIKENLKISRIKIKKFYSKKLKLESDKNFGNEIKNIYQETIPLFKFQIKKLKGYRDRYFLDKKYNFGYACVQANIKLYEKIILLNQRLSKKINYQRVKYAKKLKLASENYILEKQNYKDLTKQLLNNCIL